MLFIRKKAVDPVLLQRAREMRRDPARAEQKLWRLLRDRQLGGYKFRRQHTTAPFIADFFCAELNLIIELDGDSHGDREAYDAQRTHHLERHGFQIIRFVNDDVFWHLDCVLDAIFSECERLSTACPHPNPRPEGEGSR
jgi:very-short-patch-repair endonuclease